MCWRRHVGVDREGDDVALVDHQPHPAVGRDLVADAGDEVLRQAVRLEVVAVRLGRPRRVEAGALDGVDGRQVGERHRLDPHDHRGSRDHATSPTSARTPRGRVTYSGTRRARSSPARSAASRAAPSWISAAPSPARAASPRSTAAASARALEVDRDERLARGQLRLRAGDQQLRRPVGPDDEPVGRSGRQSRTTGRPSIPSVADRGGRAGPPRSTRRRSGCRGRGRGPWPSRARRAAR